MSRIPESCYATCAQTLFCNSTRFPISSLSAALHRGTSRTEVWFLCCETFVPDCQDFPCFGQEESPMPYHLGQSSEGVKSMDQWSDLSKIIVESSLTASIKFSEFPALLDWEIWKSLSGGINISAEWHQLHYLPSISFFLVCIRIKSSNRTLKFFSFLLTCKKQVIDKEMIDMGSSDYPLRTMSVSRKENLRKSRGSLAP